MSGQTYLTIKAVHFLGFTMWVGAMIALALALRARGAAEGAAKGAFEGLERVLARAMELGALLAIACGVLMIVKAPEGMSPMKQPYLHIKLTIVVVILAMHGLVRMSMGKMRKGTGGPPGVAVPWLLLLAAAAIFYLAVVKPMYRAG